MKMEENLVGSVNETRPRNTHTEKIFMFTLIIFTALTFGYLHYHYVSILFENDRNFSYLSKLEREMSFRTEMGFYYSYYKTVVEEKPFLGALSRLMHDKTVEYPTEVNAFNRFNIHPEVIMGALYQYFEPFINTSTHRICHIVDRSTLTPVESCTGIGEPIFFYLQGIWIMAGLTVSALFLHAATLSESILGGLLAVAQYFANHEECTRVMWAPNERENWALPLLLLQSWLLTLQLRNMKKKAALQLQVAIFIVNCFCLLFWQFTQFIFLTQIIIFFIMEQLRIIDVRTLCIFLHGHFCGLHLAVLILQGNEMLKASFYTALFMVLSFYCLFFSYIRVKVQNFVDFCSEAMLVVLRIVIVGGLTVYLKLCFGTFLNTTDDFHILHLLYTKFSSFKNFHTLLYTCSEVFGFLPWKSVLNMTKTFLIPFAVMSSVNMFNYWTVTTFERCKECRKKEMEDVKEGEDTDDSGIENNSDLPREKMKIKNENDEESFICFVKCFEVDPSVFYNISQMVVYGVMAFLVMRLKLLFATQMCVVASLLMKFNTYRFPKFMNKCLPVGLLVLTIPVFLYNMRANMLKELSHFGEFSDPAQEELLSWIINSTSPRSAFAGSMPILASVLLSTRRPVVAHPHYENSGARMRAYTVYGVYGRFSPGDLYSKLNKLQASYLIIENKYCYGKSNYKEYACDDGACVSVDRVCDQITDCSDGSDERNCYSSLNNLLQDPVLYRSKRQTSGNCKKNQWQCRDGTCIGFDGKCDGVADCPDRSDETHALCRKSRCRGYLFRCTYGACVDGTAACNGQNECADASDELLPRCTNTTRESGGRFRCDNGEMIPSVNKCDGKADCADGSDENVKACAGKTCPEYLFQCAYGACVDAGSDCNQIQDCADNSDEDDELCNRQGVPKPTTAKPGANSCVLPPYPSHGRYQVAGLDNAQPGQIMDVAFLNITCDPGYGVNGEDEVYCYNGVWSASIPKCVRFCNLNPHPSVIYQCLVSGGIEGYRNCSLYEPTGTIVRPICQAPNYYHNGYLGYMRCIDGNWDIIHRCTPECGTITPEGESYVIDGVPAYRGELPWHAAIYRKTTKPYMQICGGSLISTTAIISAAHCFWSDTQKRLPAKNYAVALGKLNRAYNDPVDDVSVQKSDVESIYIPVRFQGAAANFQEDIAILKLVTMIELRPYVRPVCLDFDITFEKRQLVDGNKGKVAGWGYTTEDGKPSPILLVINVTYINIEECISTSPANFREYINSDKICAGDKNGKALCKGDSGGGLVFPELDRGGKIRYYLRGIVSTAPKNDNVCSRFPFTTFTQVSRHESLIHEVHID